MKMLSISDFKKINIDDKKIFDKYYKSNSVCHSDNVFTTLFSWMEYAKYSYVIFDDVLVIAINVDNKIQLRLISGKKDEKILEKIVELAKKQKSEFPIAIFNGDTKKCFEKNHPKIKMLAKRDYFDYVYLSSDLAELKGSSYSKIRNRINKFNRKYSYSLESIDKDNFEEVKKFLRRWCLWRDCDKDILLKNEKKAIIKSMNNFFELGLSGIAIRIKNKIEAISVYEEMSSDMAIVHYEKGSPYYDGIYKVINQELAKKLVSKYRYINRESDMGLPGLRRAKMSYRPDHMLEVYTIHKESIMDL